VGFVDKTCKNYQVVQESCLGGGAHGMIGAIISTVVYDLILHSCILWSCLAILSSRKGPQNNKSAKSAQTIARIKKSW
jgi:hypothetical protein